MFWFFNGRKAGRRVAAALVIFVFLLQTVVSAAGIPDGLNGPSARKYLAMEDNAPADPPAGDPTAAEPQGAPEATVPEDGAGEQSDDSAGNEAAPEAAVEPDAEQSGTVTDPGAIPEDFDAENAKALPGQIIVKYKPGSEKKGISLARSMGAVGVKSVSSDVSIIEVGEGKDISGMLDKLNNDPSIEFAEENYIVRKFDDGSGGSPGGEVPHDSSDELIADQWGLSSINAFEAWPAITDTEAETVVAVLDTGVYGEHPDLTNRIALDGESKYGRNFADYKSDYTPYTDDTDYTDDDVDSHGTHVAGIIAAEYDNGIGISGVAGPCNVRILPVKVLNDEGWGTIFDIAEGIIWAADQPDVSVINLSLGTQYYSHTLEAAVRYAQEQGIIVVAAAGNEAWDDISVDDTYPAAYPGVVSVGSVMGWKYDRDEDGDMEEWFERVPSSNYGTSLDLVAPGDGIISTVRDSWDGDQYEYLNGTSMAAPHVSAVAALYKLKNPGASGAEIADALMASATDITESDRENSSVGPGWDEETGYGVVNAAAALGVVVPENCEAGFTSPVTDSEVTGGLNVTVQVTDPEQVDSVKFYLDGTEESKLLEQVDRTDSGVDQVNYSFAWDTTSGDIADGAHTLYAKMFNGDVQVGNVAQVAFTVRNGVDTGMLLKVLDPNGYPAAHAKVYLYRFRAYNDDDYSYAADAAGMNGEYEEIQPPNPYDNDSFITDGAGNLRVPGIIATDLHKYEVIVVGDFEEGPGWETFVYHRSYDSPMSDVIDGSDAKLATFEVYGKDDQPIQPYANFLFRIKDDKGCSIMLTEPWVSTGDNAIRLYMDADNLDAFAAWNPYAAEEVSSDLGLDEEFTGPAYFFVKRDIQLTENTTIRFDTSDAGTVKLSGMENTEYTELYMGNSDTNEGFIWYLEPQGQEMIVTAGEYWLGGLVYMDDWRYSFSREEDLNVSAGSNTDITFGGQLTATLELMEGETEEGASTYADCRFVDEHGNRLGDLDADNEINVNMRSAKISIVKKTQDKTLQRYVWEPEKAEWQAETKGYYYKDVNPVIKIYDGNGNFVKDHTMYSSSGFGPSYQYFDLVPGSYHAELRLPNAGPLFLYTGATSAKAPVTVVEKEPQEAMAEINVTNEYGQLGDITVEIFRWYDGQYYDEWKRTAYGYNYQPGPIFISEDTELTPGENNIAVIQHRQYNSVTGGEVSTISWVRFDSLEDLKNVSIANTIPVDVRALDHSGQEVANRNIFLELVVEGDGNTATRESIGTFSTWGGLKLKQGTYHIGTGFSSGDALYILNEADDRAIAEGIGEIEIDGSTSVPVTVNAASPEGTEDPYDILGFDIEGYNGGYGWAEFEEPVGSVSLYLSPGLYYPTTYITRKDTELPAYNWLYGMFINPGADKQDYFMPVEVAAGDPIEWNCGGPFNVDTELYSSELSQQDYLEGWNVIEDAYGNQVYRAEIWGDDRDEEPSVYMSKSNGQSLSKRPAVVRVGPRGRLVQLEEVAVAEKESYGERDEWISPFLRIYRQGTAGETKVFDRKSNEYFYNFEEDLGDWGTPGSYRAEIAIGIGPEGPIYTPNSPEAFFTIGNASEKPILYKPANDGYINSRSIGISGVAAENSKVDVYWYSEAAPTQYGKEVYTDSNGNFSTQITVAQDGNWHVYARKGTVESDEIVFHVDTVAPAKPTLTGVLAENKRTVNLNWSLGESGDVVKTELYRNDAVTPIEVLVNSYVDNSTLRGTTYTYSIVLVDRAGNRSERSDNVVIAVPAGINSAKATFGPRISYSGYAKLGSTAIVTAAATPAMSVKCRVEYDESGVIEFAMAEQQVPGNYQGSFTVAEGMKDIKHIYVYPEDSPDLSARVDVLRGTVLPVGGSVSGTISRNNTAAGGIRVDIRQAGQQRIIDSVISGADGSYRFDGLGSGNYEVSADDAAVSGETRTTTVNGVAQGVLLTGRNISLPERHNLLFTVKDANERSETLFGVYVNLWNSNVNLWGRTNKDGQLSFSNLVPGTYNWSTYGSYSLSEPYFDKSGTIDVPAPEGKAEIFLKSYASSYGSFSGIVTNSSGEPIPGVTVSTWNSSYWGQNQAVTGADGTYTIRKLMPSNNYTLIFDHPDYKKTYADNKEINDGADTKLDMQLALSIKLQGYVYGEDIFKERRALANVMVSDTSGWWSNHSTTTDGRGFFSLKDLDQGSVTVHADGYSIGYGTDSEYIEEVSTDGNPEVVLDLFEKGVIDGRIVDSEGKGIQYVYVNANGSGWGGSRTDVNGYYAIRGLVNGTYTVTTSHYSYVNQSEAGVVISDDERRATVHFSLNTPGEAAEAFGGNGNSFAASSEEAAPGEKITYAAKFKNNSNTTADNVVLSFQIPEGLDLAEGDEAPSINGNGCSYDIDPNMLTVNAGSLAAGESGTLVFKAVVDSDINMETELNVLGSISWASGGSSEEKPMGTAYISVLFTSIHAPGITSDGKFKVYGKSLPGAVISVYDGDTLLGNATAAGRWWSLDVKLGTPAEGVEEEVHTLTAQAIRNNLSSKRSNPATVVFRPDVPKIVDATITAGWNLNVKANPYTGVITMGLTEKTPITVKAEFDGTVREPKIEWLGKYYNLNEAAGVDYMVAEVPYGWQVYGEQMLKLHFKDSSGREYEFPIALIIVLIDPSGYVYEGVESNRLPGVTATVQQYVGGDWVSWNAAAFGQVNPQVTDAEGKYGWDVPAGKWRVIFSKEGYESVDSITLWDGNVPPPKTDLNVEMVGTAAPSITERSPGAGSTNIQTDAHIDVTFSKYMDVSSFDGLFTVVKDEAGTAVEGTITGVSAENGLARTIRFTPKAELESNIIYRVNVLASVKDYSGRGLADNDTWTFTTSGSKPGVLQLENTTGEISESEGTATITVTRTNGTDGTVTVDYTTSDGTALAGSDYTAASGTLTFANGETSKSFTIDIDDDSIVESAETFSITLSNPTDGALLGDNKTMIFTIVDDDEPEVVEPKPGELNFSSAEYSAGEAAGNAVITITRTNGSEGMVTVDYAASDGTATAGSDYTAASGTLTFADKEVSKTFVVAITDDAVYEGNEVINLTLSNETGATLGTQKEALLTIEENDPDTRPGTLNFSSSAYSIGEAGSSAVITVTRTNGSYETVTVDYATGNGTAAAGSDYTAASGTLTFADKEVSKTFIVPITDDTVYEGNETINLTLSNATGGASLGLQNTALLTITDNDSSGGPGSHPRRVGGGGSSTPQLPANSSTMQIGMLGGNISFNNGQAVLQIPAGAVPQNAGWTIEKLQIQPPPAGQLSIVSDVFDLKTTAPGFNSPVLFRLRYNKLLVTNPGSLRLCYWNEKIGAWVFVPRELIKIDAATGTIEAELYHFSKYAVVEAKNSKKFEDVSNQWFATYVDRMILMNITTGISEGGKDYFKPEKTLTRAEFSVFMARALNLKTDGAASLKFKDTASIPDWAKGAVAAAVEKGIITGYDGNIFGPDREISRAEMVVMLVRAMGLSNSQAVPEFKDAALIPAWARSASAEAVKNGMVRTGADNTFKPSEKVTRAETSMMIIEMIEAMAKMK